MRASARERTRQTGRLLSIVRFGRMFGEDFPSNDRARIIDGSNSLDSLATPVEGLGFREGEGDGTSTRIPPRLA